MARIAQKIIFYKNLENLQELLIWVPQKIKNIIYIKNFAYWRTDVRDVQVDWRQYPIQSKLCEVKIVLLSLSFFTQIVHQLEESNFKKCKFGVSWHFFKINSFKHEYQDQISQFWPNFKLSWF